MIVERRWRLGLLSLAAALGATLLVVVVLQALSRPHLRHRVDVSAGGSAALSERTAEALAALPAGSRLTAFLLEEEPRYTLNQAAVYPRAFARLRTLLEDARIRSQGALEVEVVEAFHSPVAVQAAMERCNRQALEVVILTTPDGGRRAFRFHDLFLTSDPTPQGLPARILQERVDTALGDAALRLANQIPLRAGIVSGYGQPGERELRGLLQLLHGEGIEPVAIRGPASEKEFDLLVLVGQQRPFLGSDAEAARTWVREGRPLFLALGPRATAEVVGFWNGLLGEGVGLQFGSGAVCEIRPRAYAFAGTNKVAELELAPGQFSSQHPATAHLAASTRIQSLVFCRPIEIDAGDDRYGRVALANSGSKAWVDQDYDFAPGPAEAIGRQVLAASAEWWQPTDELHGGRVVVLGSPDALLQRLEYARDFLAPLFRWLLHIEVPMGLVAAASVPFQPPRAVQVRMTNLAVIALPGFPLLIALLVFFRRRR